MTEVHTDPSFEALLTYLKRNRGFDFSGYKRNSLHRRIRHRMQSVAVESFEDYIDFLQVHPDEFVHLFNTILINVTEFFRDSGAWEFIDKDIIPKVIVQKEAGEPVRIWSAGVASGEEAYSIAMLLAEHLGMEEFKQRVKIYATDVDEDALYQARQATFTEKEVRSIPSALLEKYFDLTGSNYSFQKEMRRNVIFGRHEIIHDAPISRIDILICRNILMYFNSEIQTQVLNRLHFALNDEGYLILGKAELLLTHAHLFSPVDYKQRVFKKINPKYLSDRAISIQPHINPIHRVSSKRRDMHDSAFEANVSPQVVIDLHGTMTMANKRACDLFDLALEDIGRPFKDIRLSYQPVELRSLIDQAFDTPNPLLVKDIAWAPHGEHERFYNVVVNGMVAYDNTPIAVSVTFQDVTRQKQLVLELEQSNHELQTAMEELESTNEELETANEELQSTIEELETTNEELQSTNEELETMNEELQSTNEELETMNDELNQSSAEINEINNYMHSILSNIESGIIVLDSDFKVEVWNTKSEDLWGLRQNEVVGYSFFNLDSGLPVDQLKRTIRSVLSEADKVERIAIQALNRRGRNIVLNITISGIKDGKGETKGVILILDIEE